MTRTLTVRWPDGTQEHVAVHCGSHQSARRLRRRIGRALVAGEASARLDYDGLQRTAVRVGDNYYMRIINSDVAPSQVTP